MAENLQQLLEEKLALEQQGRQNYLLNSRYAKQQNRNEHARSIAVDRDDQANEDNKSVISQLSRDSKRMNYGRRAVTREGGPRSVSNRIA